MTRSDWLSPNGKYLNEARPSDIRTLSDKQLKKLRRFLLDYASCYSKDWLSPTQHWELFGVLDCVDNVLSERRRSNARV